MVPLTCLHANKDHIHGELAKTYYTQRSCVLGALIISEATFIAPQVAGYTYVPGIWNEPQIAGWKTGYIPHVPRADLSTDLRPKITGAVHTNGSYILLQLWVLGRAADPVVINQEDGFDLVAPSLISLDKGGLHSREGEIVPRELTVAKFEK